MRIASKHIKGYSTLLVIRDVQIKTTVRYYFTPSRMVSVEKTEDSKCMWSNWDAFTLLVEM